MHTSTRRILGSLFFVVILAEASHAEGPAKPKAFVEKWAATIKENDMSKLLAFYDKSEKLDITVSAGRRYQGFQQLKKMYTESEKEIRFLESRADKIHVRDLGETAVVSYEHRFEFEVKSDGSKFKAHIRTSTVLHKLKGHWKIVHEHSSAIDGVERLQRTN